MPIVTVQLGQCGNQLGLSFFQTLAAEFGGGDYSQSGVEEWFRPVLSGGSSYVSSDPLAAYGHSAHKYVARSVLIDMEPKVVNTVRSTAASSGHWWSYPKKGFLCMQSGAGNNWAHGYNGFGPKVHDAALDLIRKEVEACDVLGGFLLFQSMAGGTGAGLGTYVAQALRDEYLSSHCVNCCVWPYESGEVLVQSYNTLFTLSHLSEMSDGIITMENEALHKVCKRLYNIPRPSFQDMNAVAARSMACMLLPSTLRTPHGPPSQTGQSQAPPSGSPLLRSSTSTSSASSFPGRGGTRASSTGPPPYNAHHPPSVTLVSGRESRKSREFGAGERLWKPEPVHFLSDFVEQLCSHPWYRMLTLRSLPQLPATSVDFTTFTWPAITKRLRQMLITGSTSEEGLDWGLTLPLASQVSSATSSAHTRSPPGPSLARQGSRMSPAQPETGGLGGGSGLTPAEGGTRQVNKSVAGWLVLRGQGAGELDVSDLFTDPGLYPSWSVDPIAVSSHTGKFAKCEKAAVLCSNDQSCVAPLRKMQSRACDMLSSRAFVHQYEQYGLQERDFHECFACIEDIAERYTLL